MFRNDFNAMSFCPTVSLSLFPALSLEIALCRLFAGYVFARDSAILMDHYVRYVFASRDV